MRKKLPSILLIAIMTILCGTAAAGVFDLEESTITPSPSEVRTLEFKDSEKILDYDVARTDPRAAVLVKNASGGFRVVFWDINAQKATREWPVPKEFTPRALAWHPLGTGLFLAGTQGAEHAIARVEERGTNWNFQVIFKSRQEIRRLVPGPRPYAVDFNAEKEEYTKAYRVFFGVRDADGTYSIRSVTEQGKRDYQVIGKKKGITTFKDADGQPSTLEAPSALPLSFHPAGHILIWEDANHCFHRALYGRESWENTAKLNLCGGSITATPNGLALIQWRQGSAGVTILSDRGGKQDVQAGNYTFTSTPSSVPDGRGIVGQLKKDGKDSLAYVPIQVPLADVANAWMFAGNPKDGELLDHNGGLFRDLPDDQLYSVYESEAYQCGAYDPSVPTRPYLVTTDVFWELLAAAYEGIFIVGERQQAIPAFWAFIDEADRFYTQSMPDSRWTKVFAVLSALKNPSSNDAKKPYREELAAELALIGKAEGKTHSPLLGDDVELDYSELKPRGHYTATEAMETYFKAFKYLVNLATEELPLDDLRGMSPAAQARGLAWINAYESFISPSRSALVLRNDQLPVPAYTNHPYPKARMFPLSWGFDNEVLLSTVYHDDWPEPEQVKGPGGPRLNPSGLDVAAALGNEFAYGLLSEEMKKFPPLVKALKDLRARRPAIGADAKTPGNLYDRWMNALALQWAEGVAPPEGGRDRELWNVKRLQTGLASWATLRHATVLVNERTTAECGEGAFEPILLTPPRGYVEPDPQTFQAIARIFRSLEEMVQSWKSSPEGTLPTDTEEERESLKEGVLKRLRETIAKADLFRGIAEKEIARQPITSAEYEEILYVGRIAEHHFLVFKSLADKEYALSNPDPMPKITDVAGGGLYNVAYLMSAVGRPMEWNHIVPYFGRKEIVKGAVYSYYEFISEKLMNDKEWLEALPGKKHPDWVSKFVSGSAVECPPKNPY